MITKSALVVDDTPANRDFLERLMTAAGFTVIGAEKGMVALEAVKTLPDLMLAIVDMELPDMSGIQLTSMLRQQFPALCIIVATMHDDVALMESVFKKGGNVFLVKPHGFMELYKRLTTADLSVLRDGGCLVIDQYGPRPFSAAVS